MKDQVGLYLGSNSVGAAHLKAKKIVSLSQLDFSFESEGSPDLNEDVKWGASITKILRYVKVDVPTEAYVSLSDKDFIFRFFDIPLMKKGEVDSALFYEAEKYIPFKLNELVFTYDYFRKPKDKKISISFIGFRKSSLDLIKRRLNKIGVTSVAIEPSSVSLVRLLKERKEISNINNFAVLDFTSSEGYLTFFQNDSVVLNRYLTLTKKEGNIDVEKFVEAVNFSFQFFKREFKAANLEKLILIGQPTKELEASLVDTMQLKIETITPSDLASRPQATVESIKAVGVTQRPYAKVYKFKPVLKEAMRPEEKREVTTEPPPPLHWLAIGASFILGLIIPFFMLAYSDGEIKIQEHEYKQKIESAKIPDQLEGLSWSKIENRLQEQRKKNKSLQAKKESLFKLADFLDALSSTDEVLPKGVWFERFDIEKNGRKSAQLRGFVFRGDSYQERRAIDELIANLKSSTVVSSIFSEIRVDSSSRRQMKDFYVTSFSVTLGGR